jgi:hypothetical protein
MPIKPNALPSPSPDEPDNSPDAVASVGTELGQSGTGAEEPAKRKRRTKDEMIADAVVPADDEPVEIKDALTGAKITRPWTDAVALVKAGTAQWVDKAMKYALLKAEQASGGPASQEPMGAADTGEPSAQTPSPATHDASGQRLAPEGAALGDEVVIGPETYIVGHGGVLVQGVVAVDGEIVKPKLRWQRELGAGPEGPWESSQLSQAADKIHEALQSQAADDERARVAQNGNGDIPVVQTERLPREAEQVNDYTWKVGNGILEKIGLPDYSSLQVGPITASRMVVDDGRRIEVELNDGRMAQVPAAVVEAFEEIDNTVEYIAKRFRGQLMSFLASTGALKQPVS